MLNIFCPVIVCVFVSVTAVPITAPAFIDEADIPAPDKFGGEENDLVPPIVSVDVLSTLFEICV